MKLLRVGEVGNEIPAALDDKGIIRDLSDHINDFSAESLNFDNLNNLKKLDLKNLSPSCSFKTSPSIFPRSLISSLKNFVGILS